MARKRSVVVATRVNRAERALISAAAEIEGTSIAGFLLREALQGARERLGRAWEVEVGSGLTAPTKGSEP